MMGRCDGWPVFLVPVLVFDLGGGHRVRDGIDDRSRVQLLDPDLDSRKHDLVQQRIQIWHISTSAWLLDPVPVLAVQ